MNILRCTCMLIQWFYFKINIFYLQTIINAICKYFISNQLVWVNRKSNSLVENDVYQQLI